VGVNTSVKTVAHTGRVRSAIDLKHVGLIVSAGAAVSLRFFSDFSFATIEHQAALAGIDVASRRFASFGALLLSTLSYELDRDWFNLSPQAPFEVTGLVVGLLGAYAALRITLGAEAAVGTVLLATPFIPLITIVGACGWVVLRVPAHV
jgi:hypothetical protein